MISTNEHIAANSGLSTIEVLTKEFATHYAMLASVVQDIDAAIKRAQGLYAGPLADAIARAKIARKNLHAAIEAAPELFESPRTQTFHGIKVGLTKGKGGIEIEDEEKTVTLIHKMFGDDAKGYLHTVETPDKEILAAMPASELKKLGCTIIGTGDQVVIKPAKSETAKAVAALLKDENAT